MHNTVIVLWYNSLKPLNVHQYARLYSGGEAISDAVDIVEDRYGDEDICAMKLLVLV